MHVRLGRTKGDRELLCDLPVGQPLRQQPQHLQLPPVRGVIPRAATFSSSSTIGTPSSTKVREYTSGSASVSARASASTAPSIPPVQRFGTLFAYAGLPIIDDDLPAQVLLCIM